MSDLKVGDAVLIRYCGHRGPKERLSPRQKTQLARYEGGRGIIVSIHPCKTGCCSAIYAELTIAKHIDFGLCCLQKIEPPKLSKYSFEEIIKQLKDQQPLSEEEKAHERE